jgi:cobalt-zinc-cadmium efflux system outer membrane protein
MKHKSEKIADLLSKSAKKHVRMLLLAVFVIPLALSSAQQDLDSPQRYPDFKTFLQLVRDRNFDFAIEKFNVSIADAEIEMAKVSPDPALSFNWTENAEDTLRSGYGYSVELGKTIEFGGKRGARIELAKSKKELSIIMLSDYFRELRAHAAITYIDALAKNQIYKLKLDSYQAMKKLSDAIKVRYELGANMKIDVMQSELETGILFNELMQSEVECKNVANELSDLIGLNHGDDPIFPSGSLKKPQANYEFKTLLESALANRTDLLVAKQNRIVAEKSTILAAKNRIFDIDLSIGYGNDFNTLEEAPIAKNFTAGISVPLKFSNFRKGELKIARYQKKQAEEVIKKVHLHIHNEMAQVFRNYESALKQVENYENGLLQKSKDVLSGKMYSYQRGETSLLDVLNAQRTFNEVQATYFESLKNCLVSLIELERVAGFWDVEIE